MHAIYRGTAVEASCEAREAARTRAAGNAARSGQKAPEAAAEVPWFSRKRLRWKVMKFHMSQA